MSSRTGELVFGVAAHSAPTSQKKQLEQFAVWVSERAGVSILAARAQSYDDLTAMVGEGRVQLAWLPPIPFIGLARGRVVTPLVCHQRAGDGQYDAVMIVHKDAHIETLFGLQGKRAAWVDPLSASGYVLPRIQLAALGVDPRTTFRREQFFGSHDAVVRAVVGGKSDVAGTYARLDAEGNVLRGSWMEIAGAADVVKVLGVFGQIPADVLALRRDVTLPVRGRIREALLSAHADPKVAPVVRDLFGVDSFAPWRPAGYEPLRRAMAEAATRGLLDVVEAPTGNFPPGSRGTDSGFP